MEVHVIVESKKEKKKNKKEDDREFAQRSYIQFIRLEERRKVLQRRISLWSNQRRFKRLVSIIFKWPSSVVSWNLTLLFKILQG